MSTVDYSQKTKVADAPILWGFYEAYFINISKPELYFMLQQLIHDISVDMHTVFK